jgi:hypothetical protein
VASRIRCSFPEETKSSRVLNHATTEHESKEDYEVLWVLFPRVSRRRRLMTVNVTRVDIGSAIFPFCGFS